MGKNHRHKKKLNAEKAKVHIKTKTKFLPKGQNVTNTAFKIKPIIVQEQLKQRDQSSVSKRKLSVPELVSKLRHHNDTIKVEACVDLIDLFKSQPFEVVQMHFAGIVQNTSILIQDRERKVRKSCINLLSQIMESVQISTLEPFFKYILTNLKCAMTNINRNIQEDSLLLVDALLEFQPIFLVTNFELFFSDFLTLISKLRSHSSLERTLSLNLGDKVSSVKWRIKVLTRLYGMLNVIVNNIQPEDSATLFACKARGKCFIPIIRDSSVYEKPALELFQTRSTETATVNINLNVLIPLLYESWLEIVPEKTLKKNQSMEQTALPAESFAVLSCTVKILGVMQQYTRISDCEKIFSCEQTLTFLDHLINNFPYNCNKRSNSEFMKEFSKLFDINTDQNCVEENLLIIYLFMITANVPNKIKNKMISITSYLNNCLKFPNYLNAASTSYMVKILTEIFINRPSIWHRHGVNGMEILDNLVLLFNRGNVPENLKGDILHILTSSNLALKSEKHQEWLQHLPSLLATKQVSAKLIDVILDLSRKNHKAVEKGVKFSLKSILENLPSMEIIEATDKEQARRHLAYIFFYLHLSSIDINIIQNFIQMYPSVPYSTYFRDVLDLRLYMGQ